MTLRMEAGGEGREGMRAVAHVLFNRLRKQDAATIAGVCLRRLQFSCWNDDKVNGSLRLRTAELPDDDPILNLARSLLDDVENGDADPTRGATHYKRIGTDADWALGHIPSVVIGHHEFFNDVA